MADGRDRPLSREDLAADPLAQFDRWFREARDAGVPMPEAVALATAGPSARMVLLKGYDARGLVFATGYGSRKARELERDPRGALLFYWHALGRQVRVEGEVAKTSAEESGALHAARPRASRVAAWASRQSAELSGREELDAAVARYEREFAGGDVPRPPHWGGYRLRPEAWEFWQHRENRLHDRFAYRREGESGGAGGERGGEGAATSGHERARASGDEGGGQDDERGRASGDESGAAPSGEERARASGDEGGERDDERARASGGDRWRIVRLGP